jgi:hypothetical protein
MNAIDRLKQIRSSALNAFVGLSSGLFRGDKVHVLSNPTEEIVEEVKNGKRPKLFLASGGPGAKARLEENYLYDTRRFPSFVSGETFPALLGAGEYLYFMNAQGSPAANNGFSPATVPTMSDVETNMDTPGQVPQGKNFVMTQVGVSFNADIAAADAANLLESGAIRFEKQGGQFTIRHGSPKYWPGGSGLALITANVTGNGSPDVRAVRKLAVPRVLGQRDNFAYKFIIPRAYRNTLGVTAVSNTSTATLLTAPVIMTIWLWGGQEDTIPT